MSTYVKPNFIHEILVDNSNVLKILQRDNNRSIQINAKGMRNQFAIWLAKYYNFASLLAPTASTPTVALSKRDFASNF